MRMKEINLNCDSSSEFKNTADYSLEGPCMKLSAKYCQCA